MCKYNNKIKGFSDIDWLPDYSSTLLFVLNNRQIPQYNWNWYGMAVMIQLLGNALRNKRNISMMPYYARCHNGCGQSHTVNMWAVDRCIRFNRGNPTWRWLKKIPTPQSKKKHIFLMTLRQIKKAEHAIFIFIHPVVCYRPMVWWSDLMGQGGYNI